MFKDYLPQILVSLVCLVLTYCYTNSIAISISISTILFVILLIYHPNRRYFRAFWFLISLMVSTNAVFLELVGNMFQTNYNLRFESLNNIQSLGLIALAAYCLWLDFKKNNPSKKNEEKNQKNDHDSTSSVVQNHFGKGDNIGGNKY